jgi:thiol-disulfide isomerase/thioredoxin
MTPTRLKSVILPDLHMIARIGRLSVPVWAILLLAAYLCGYVYLRISLRKKRDQRILIVDRVTSGILIVFLVWKIAPIIANLRTAFAQPLYMLYATGGVGALIIGVFSGVIYVALSLRRLPNGNKQLRRPVLRGITGFLVVASTVFVIGTITTGIATTATFRDESASTTAPEFTLYTLTGEETSLSDHLGKTVILNFWATWCPPCRAEIPLLIDFATSIDPEKMVILSVNQTASEKSLESLQAFVLDMGIEFPILLDPDNRVFARYGVRGIPTTFIIAPDGTIEDRRSGVISRSWLDRRR